MPAPEPGDWLYRRYEPGETFAEYVNSNSLLPDEHRRVIYIQPLGGFSAAQRRIIGLAAEFIGIFYNLSVKVNEDMPLSAIPEPARRRHPQWGIPQILTSYILERLLVPTLPSDAAAYLCFTSSDLWPGEGWNFVFGQASLEERVGVWSIYHNGDPDKSDEDFVFACCAL